MNDEDHNLTILSPYILICHTSFLTALQLLHQEQSLANSHRFLPFYREATATYDCQVVKCTVPGREVDVEERKFQIEVEILDYPPCGV